jgi:CBS domain-containing protein
MPARDLRQEKNVPNVCVKEVHMSLQQFCERAVVTVAPDQSVAEACRLLQEKNVGCIVATDAGQVRGILTDRDIALKVTGDKKDPQRTKVRDVMRADPIRITVNKSLHDLTALMHAHHVRRVPIVDGGDKLLGIVTLDDLLMLLSEEMADMGKGISGALFRRPSPRGPAETVMPLDWLMSYL